MLDTGFNYERPQGRIRRIAGRFIAALTIALLLGSGQLLRATPASAESWPSPPGVTLTPFNGSEAVASFNSADEHYDRLSGQIQIPAETYISDTHYNVTAVSVNGFQSEGINYLSLSENLRTIGNGAFSGNKLYSVNLPSTITDIGSSAFANNRISSITIPAKVTSIGASAFAGNTLTTVKMTGPRPTVTAAGASGSFGPAGVTVRYPVRYSGGYGSPFAGYTAQAYAVVDFNMNGNGAAIPSREVNAGLTTAIPPTPIAAGRVFTGWYTDAALTAPFVFSTPINADTTLHAGWGSTVNFDLGGHGGAVADQTVHLGKQAVKPPTPTATGWTFTNWFSNPGRTTPFNFGSAINAHTTLYAGWSINTSAVTFNMGGHGTAIDAQTINYGQTATQPPAPTAPGFDFGGWHTTAGLTAAFDFATPINANTTIFAKWTAVAPSTVTFNLGGHGTAIDAQTINYGLTADEPAPPAETGWTFTGWYTTAALTTAFDFDTPITSATSIFAGWERTIIAVTIALTGNGADSTLTVPLGDLLPEPAAPTAAGFTFTGWFTDAALKTPFNFEAPITVATTVYAGWKSTAVTPTPTPT
ncbi:InlB B-repeat-containing protein, partial [Glaciibacter psychrotolerans]